MARSYGRIATSIWRDDDFRELSSEARLTYIMLISQPGISPAGVIELTGRRWAGNLGYTEQQLTGAIDELEKNEYLVVDWDVEEVLVRTFVKWDGGVNNDLRRKAVRDAANVVSSLRLRQSMVVEFDRMGIPHDLSNGCSGPVTRARAGPIDTPSIGHQNPMAGPIAEGLDRRGVVVKSAVPRDPQPLTATREGEALSDAPSETTKEPPSTCSKHPNGTEERCGPCGAARRRLAVWLKTEAGRTADAKAAAVAARGACPYCDEDGWLLDDDRLPTGARCKHLEATP